MVHVNGRSAMNRPADGIHDAGIIWPKHERILICYSDIMGVVIGFVT